jgi:hypothetical protein
VEKKLANNGIYKIHFERSWKTIYSEMSEDEKLYFANIPKFQLIDFAFTFMSYIRSRVRLWTAKWTRQHPDIVSNNILERVWEELQKHGEFKRPLKDTSSNKELPEELRHIDFWKYIKNRNYYDKIIKQLPGGDPGPAPEGFFLDPEPIVEYENMDINERIRSIKGMLVELEMEDILKAQLEQEIKELEKTRREA